jgi:taurine dioxygenase
MTPGELELLPLEAPLGAEVRGIDATTTLSDQVVRELKVAIAEHACIVLRNQRLSCESEHVAFAERLGDTVIPWLHAVERNTLARIKELPGRPGYTGEHASAVYFVNGPEYRDKADDGYLQGWHADMTHLQVPLPYATLYCAEAPDYGYETWFANQYLAYESLDETTRRRVDELEMCHSFRHVFPNLPPVIHPVALKHPISGRKAIYGIPGVADASPLGVSRVEGEEIMAKLTAHLGDERFVYRHVWRTGDLVIWDNRCTLHRRGPQAHGQTRVLRRVMAGDGTPEEVRRQLMGYV